MLISYNWLNKYFDGKLPTPEIVADKLTMNFLEVEGVMSKDNDFVLDVKVTPNLAHSALSHRGIARLLGALLKIKPNLTAHEVNPIIAVDTVQKLAVNIEDEKKCRRYIGRVVTNVKVGPSPEWLKRYLEVLGQRSINNIVDATNFVMLEIGQPLHAFDADKLNVRDGVISIDIKSASEGSQMTTLDGKLLSLNNESLVISNDNRALALAGIKGGVIAELDNNTQNIVLESANFNSTLIRKTSHFYKIQTDASKRYENDYSPELALEAMNYLTSLVLELAGTSRTEVGLAIDNYPRPANPHRVGVNQTEVSDKLGVEIGDNEIESIFSDLGFVYKKVKPIDEVIKTAESLLGRVYKLGSSVTYDAPRSFDCSGFVAYCYVQGGVSLPRISVDQYVYTKRVLEQDLIAGDIIFCNSQVGRVYTSALEFMRGEAVPSGIDHVVLYIGNDEVIHASEKQGQVVKRKFTELKQAAKVVGFGRVCGNDPRWLVTAQPERMDIRIKEDLIEDIGMVFGYSKIGEKPIKPAEKQAIPDKSYYYECEIRKILGEIGFSEVYNYSFTAKGEIEVANPINVDLPFMRADLTDGINRTLDFNTRYADLIDMNQVKVFEFGNVFKLTGEERRFVLGVKSSTTGKNGPKDKEVLQKAVEKIEEVLKVKLPVVFQSDNVFEIAYKQFVSVLPEPTEFKPDLSLVLSGFRYQKISAYPFMVRDIAVFVPEGVTESDLLDVIKNNATGLLIKTKLFDVFVKKSPDGSAKTSYASRLIFQSYERTLASEEVDKIMLDISRVVGEKGWQVR